MNSLKLEFNKAWELIGKSENIFLTTHEGTDGDDLGSLLALRSVLLNQKKKFKIGIKGGVPPSLQFLPGVEDVEESFDLDNYDLVITFGCNKLSRPGWDELLSLNVPIVNFDHHPDNTNFGFINVVDPAASAVAELIYDFFTHLEIVLDKNIATCLLTGIFTDTGGFKHANTTAHTLEAAAALMKKGARIDKIAFNTMAKHQPRTAKAWAKGLENTRFDPERKLVYSVLTKEDLGEIGASDDDLDGFVELLNHIPQAKFALVLRQDGDEVKGSLRSEPHKNVDVSKIAKSFGGGGHKLASGFKIKGNLVKDKDVWKII